MIDHATARPLLSTKQVGRRLKLDDKTVRVLAERGELEVVRLGHVFRFTQEGLDKVLNTKKASA